MSDQGYGAAGSEPQAQPANADAQQAAPGYAPSAPHATQAAPPRKSRAWMWVAIVIALAVIAFSSCCGLMFWSIGQSGGSSEIGVGPAVAVIYIDSEIAGVGDGLSGGTITPESVMSQLKKAADDPSVKAVLLRIDSPGGTASASEEIAAEVARFKKPIVASIGDVGASGAYMIASQCDAIIASPSSDVGSIGVILAVGDFSEALDKLGIRYEVIAEGKYKDAGSPFRALTKEEKALLTQDMDLVYEQFIKIVADGRKMPVGEVRKLATGWAWPGEKAKELGLVDELGNYSDALLVAGKRGGIKGQPRVVTYGGDSFEALLQELSGIRRQLSIMGAVGLPAEQSRPAVR